MNNLNPCTGKLKEAMDKLDILLKDYDDQKETVYYNDMSEMLVAQSKMSSRELLETFGQKVEFTHKIKRSFEEMQNEMYKTFEKKERNVQLTKKVQ